LNFKTEILSLSEAQLQKIQTSNPCAQQLGGMLVDAVDQGRLGASILSNRPICKNCIPCELFSSGSGNKSGNDSWGVGEPYCTWACGWQPPVLLQS